MPPGLTALTAALTLLAPLASAIGQKKIIAFEPSDGALQVAGGDLGAGQIRVSDGEFWGVVRAAGDLAADFGRVTGTNYSLSNGEAGAGSLEYRFEPADVSDNTVVSVLFLWMFPLCLEGEMRLLPKGLGDFASNAIYSCSWRPCVLVAAYLAHLHGLSGWTLSALRRQPVLSNLRPN